MLGIVRAHDGVVVWFDRTASTHRLLVDTAMLTLRSILIPTDRSFCAERAYGPAAQLADRYGATLRTVHVAEVGYVPTDDAAADVRLPSEHALPGDLAFSEEIAASHASPALDILAYARKHDVDLIVMGTHGRLGFGHFFLGSVTERVVRLADRPVLTVPCDDVPEGAPVLAPVDFSDGSRDALRDARDLADGQGVALHVLHVLDWPTPPPPYLVDFGLPSLPELLERAQAELGAFVGDTVGLSAVTAVRVRAGGLAAYTTAEYAREVTAGLIVISTHGRTGLARVLMGSVAEHVVRMAPCPVLTVRPGPRGHLSASSEARAAVGTHAVDAESTLVA